MEQSIVKVKLNNVKLYNEANALKEEKEQAKELIIGYKNALETQKQEIEILKKENQELQAKYEKIPEFIRNFF